MQRRTLENLTLENEDYHFEGDLTIKGDVIIKNSNLTVTGTINFSKESSNISIIGGNISSKKLLTSAPITIRDGDITVDYLAADSNIDSDSNIEVSSYSYAQNITCMNYLVSGNNNSKNITCMQDIYIIGTNNSYYIKARDVLIGGTCILNNFTLTAKSFLCEGEVIDCSSMLVG